ncbi:MAG: hypothetical protein LBT45_02090 [Rickettsiales bacterium]|jgi:hypothetical protein|nr:hypothetical protein [Rickettsiales bacterium]
MKVSYRHFNAEEAWQNMICMYDWYWKENASRFGYKNVSIWTPDWKECIDAFADPDRQRIKLLRHDFISKIYNEKDLSKHDEYIESTMVPDLELFADFFGAIMKRQGFGIPGSCGIWSTYGRGGSYNYETPRIILRISQIDDSARIGLIAKHEFVHIMIEKPIIQRYNIPQDVKESIVDIICEQYFDKQTQNFPILPFVRKYTDKDAI